MLYSSTAASAGRFAQHSKKGEIPAIPFSLGHKAAVQLAGGVLLLRRRSFLPGVFLSVCINQAYVYRPRSVCVKHNRPLSALDGSVGGEGKVPVRTEDGPAEHGGDGMQEDVVALLAALEARYTLIYGGATPGTVVPRSGGGRGGSSCGGTGDGRSPVCGADSGRVAPPEAPPEGLELTLVSGGDGSGCFPGGGGSAAREGRWGGSGSGGGGKRDDVEDSAMAGWLLDHAVAILVDAIPPARREAS